MKIKGGYFKKILHIDLDTGRAEKRKINSEFALKYIGGRGFGIKLVWDNLLEVMRDKGRLDPLGAENLIVVAPGPLTGVYLPASGKTSFVSISPATGAYADSNIGGSFGVELRQAGYDAAAIRGCAPELSYIFIDDDDVRIVPKPELKGKTSLAAEGIIRDEIGDCSVKVATIGPAGENLVRFACITADWGRNAGRLGMGAILGSKNIKAIAVRGSKDLPVHDVEVLQKCSRKAYRTLSSHIFFEFWQQQGLMSVVDYVNEKGVMPTHNFRDGHFPLAANANGQVMETKYKIGDSACFACSMACSNICLVKDGPYAGTVVEGPEYETACMFGSNVGVDNFAFILKANQMCDELGIDTISGGALIAALIEGYESGLLTLEDVDGLPLHWGDEEDILKLIKKIAAREGVGNTLADSSRGVIARWPQLAPLISQVKGLEQSAYDCRAAISMALAYGTSDIGAHHARAWTIGRELELGQNWTLDEKADIVIYHQTIRPLFDMLGVCRLPWIELGFSEKEYSEFFHAVTGVPFTLDDLLARSRHLYDVTRTINMMLGLRRKDDYPPERVFTIPLKTGPNAGKVVNRAEYDRLLDIYYRKRGWDADGTPPMAKEYLRA